MDFQWVSLGPEMFLQVETNWPLWAKPKIISRYSTQIGRYVEADMKPHSTLSAAKMISRSHMLCSAARCRAVLWDGPLRPSLIPPCPVPP